MSFSTSTLHHPIRRPARGPDQAGDAKARLQPIFSIRHSHVLRLHDILLHLLSLPPSHTNSVQSLRAWRALAKCKEIDLPVLYKIGAKVLERTREAEDEDQDGDEEKAWRSGRKAEWLKWSQEGKLDKVDKFIEYVLSLAAAGRARHALDELERCAFF
jgi:hypothetical protein